MGEKLRPLVAGGIYHVNSRGNARQTIFLDDLDNLEFLRLLATAVVRAGFICHSYCLIPNHYHLLLETPEPNLDQGMRLLNRRYAHRFNQRYERVGHVFQGPYRAELLQRDAHLLEVCRYIALNPVRAGLCEDPADWPWSSYSALAGLVEPPTFLTLDLVHAMCGGAAGFRSFVADGAERQRPGRDVVATRSPTGVAR
jgi:REP element-mobilizing transposase RayT